MRLPEVQIKITNGGKLESGKFPTIINDYSLLSCQRNYYHFSTNDAYETLINKKQLET